MDPSKINPDEFDPMELPEGSSGFLDAYLVLESMVEKDYDFIDISLLLREEFGEELTEKVLEEAKLRGILQLPLDNPKKKPYVSHEVRT